MVTVQTLRVLTNSGAQEQVDELLRKLQELKEELDRGVCIQMLQTVDQNGEPDFLR
jgi:hypothetical protein